MNPVISKIRVNEVIIIEKKKKDKKEVDDYTILDLLIFFQEHSKK